MIDNYTPGQGCQCHAHSEAECGCDVDWTPREVYELRATISDMEIRHSAAMLHTQSIVNEANELREQRDRLAAIARELTAMIRVNVMWGRFAECTVEQIDEHLKPWNEKIAAVEGGES